MKRFITKYSILQIFGVIALTAFFFSYLLVENPQPYIAVRGVYYGKYVWPVGLLFHQVLGPLGWEIFVWGMGLWTVYALPVYAIIQGIFGVTIPFSTTPLIANITEPTLWEWSIMGATVIVYNTVIMLIIPYFFKVIHLILLGAKYAEINKVDRRGN
ncbi:hypothetical protein KC573_02630, partial [candidate division WWE3 bacterium]|nr:hypothetical protein [candidate division WWE3 bacterium]